MGSELAFGWVSSESPNQANLGRAAQKARASGEVPGALGGLESVGKTFVVEKRAHLRRH